MHNNYYFLRQLSHSIATRLHNGVVSECFSQSKEELIIRFEIGRESYYVKASLLPTFSCVSLPDNFHRARKNSVDLFQPMTGEKLIGVRQFENERSFALNFTNNVSLLFKMHGTRSNLLLFENGNLTQLFKQNLVADRQINLDSLDRAIDWSREAFEKNVNDLQQLYFTFGKVIWKYLRQSGFDSKPIDERWKVIQEVRSQLERSEFFITEVDNVPVLSMMRTGDIQKSFSDPVKAVNEFYYTFTQEFALRQEKSIIRSLLNSRLQSSYNYLTKTTSKLREIEADTNYKVWADLVMANLHQIKTGTDKITVDNFYNANHPVEIKLKKDLTPQKNAEVFYRKSKNQKIEVEHLKQAISVKEGEILRTQIMLEDIEQINDLKALREHKSKMGIDLSARKDIEILPYHEFIFSGYKIWVGKNAEGNDRLTLKYSFKEDLWLHAKDVPGSHVIIKHQSGKNFPKDVIERAAELAAYNSKRKTETLCPVIVTPKKFVRKRKGDPPGAVVVEREEVILVEPRLNAER